MPETRKSTGEALQLLEDAGIRSTLDEYLRTLGDLERRRPLPGGDYRQFQKVVLYREAVMRLSLGMAAATANVSQCLDDGIRATACDADLKILFRIAMQCQIIDDVLDYSQDLSVGLPSFLTACHSLPRAFDLTRLAALAYADDPDLPRIADLFALRSALVLVSTCAKLVIAFGRWRLDFSRRGSIHNPTVITVPGIQPGAGRSLQRSST